MKPGYTRLLVSISLLSVVLFWILIPQASGALGGGVAQIRNILRPVIEAALSTPTGIEFHGMEPAPYVNPPNTRFLLELLNNPKPNRDQSPVRNGPRRTVSLREVASSAAFCLQQIHLPSPLGQTMTKGPA